MVSIRSMFCLFHSIISCIYDSRRRVRDRTASCNNISGIYMFWGGGLKIEQEEREDSHIQPIVLLATEETTHLPYGDTTSQP